MPKLTPLLLIFALHLPAHAQESSLTEQRTDKAEERPFADRLVDAAMERTRHSVVYDGSYYKLKYPGGDVPESIGVCLLVQSPGRGGASGFEQRDQLAPPVAAS